MGVSGHRCSLAAVVTAPGLCFKDEESAGGQALVDPFEEPGHAHVPRLQVNPLGQAQTHDHVVLAPPRPRLLHRHKVALWEEFQHRRQRHRHHGAKKAGASAHLDEGDVVGEPG